MTTYDVVVGGGGVAGCCAAAALSELGFRVLVVETGLDSSRRLAGELIHPPGVANMKALGLLSHLEDAGATRVLGFGVFPNSTDTAAQILPYSNSCTPSSY